MGISCQVLEPYKSYLGGNPGSGGRSFYLDQCFCVLRIKARQLDFANFLETSTSDFTIKDPIGVFSGQSPVDRYRTGCSLYVGGFSFEVA